MLPHLRRASCFTELRRPKYLIQDFPWTLLGLQSLNPNQTPGPGASHLKSNRQLREGLTMGTQSLGSPSGMALPAPALPVPPPVSPARGHHQKQRVSYLIFGAEHSCTPRTAAYNAPPPDLHDCACQKIPDIHWSMERWGARP